MHSSAQHDLPCDDQAHYCLLTCLTSRATDDSLYPLSLLTSFLDNARHGTLRFPSPACTFRCAAPTNLPFWALLWPNLSPNCPLRTSNRAPTFLRRLWGRSLWSLWMAECDAFQNPEESGKCVEWETLRMRRKVQMKVRNLVISLLISA